MKHEEQRDGSAERKKYPVDSFRGTASGAQRCCKLPRSGQRSPIQEILSHLDLQLRVCLATTRFRLSRGSAFPTWPPSNRLSIELVETLNIISSVLHLYCPTLSDLIFELARQSTPPVLDRHRPPPVPGAQQSRHFLRSSRLYLPKDISSLERHCAWF